MSSAPVVVWRMPQVVTLDDLTVMKSADDLHRYELSPEGVLSVTPPLGYAHAIIATRLTLWLGAGGIPADRFAQTVGLRIHGDEGVGGRIPDLVVWGKAQEDGVWLSLDDVLLVVEIVSPGSIAMDSVTKRREYAIAGIPQYWTVDQDAAQNVTMYHLDGDQYVVRATMPLAWLLNTGPAEYDLDQDA
jgi:Uma2 family endonuclease